MTLENIMKSVMEELKQVAKTETIVGKQIIAGGSTIVPISKVSLGIAGGGGSGKDNKEGAGLGGGATIEPIAFIVVTNGKAQLLPLHDNAGTLGKVIDLIPDVLDKFSGKGDSKQKEDEPS
jgi:sporulation protein YtfJ